LYDDTKKGNNNTIVINPRFSKGGGEGELLLSKGGLRRLFLPPMAEAYTYQDVENAYNNAVAQYSKRQDLD